MARLEIQYLTSVHWCQSKVIRERNHTKHTRPKTVLSGKSIPKKSLFYYNGFNSLQFNANCPYALLLYCLLSKPIDLQFYIGCFNDCFFCVFFNLMLSNHQSGINLIFQTKNICIILAYCILVY